MPPKPKAKPKPQPRRAAAAAAGAQTAPGDSVSDPVNLDSSTLKEPKQEPVGEDAVSNPPTQAAPSNRSYKSASLFIEDHSDSEGVEEQPKQDNRPSSSLHSKPVEHVHFDLDHDDKEDSDDEEAIYSDGDDDPVVQSYDIVINNTLDDMMYLFQYPVRNKTQPYTLQDGFAPVEARMKVNTGVVELDIPINVDRNYDEQKGIKYGEILHKSRLQRSLRAGVPIDGAAGRIDGPSDRRKRRRTAGDEDGDDEDDIPTPEPLLDFQEAKRKGRVLNRQTLGAKVQHGDANYFVGLFEGDKLHLTRLNGSLQLRPQFHHIDIMTEQERANQKAIREMNNPSTAKPMEARAVNLQVKAASGDNRTLTAAEQLSKDIRQEEDEPWREIEWVDQDEDEAWQMFANVHKQEPVPLNNVLTKAEYFKWCSTPANPPDGHEDARGHRHHGRLGK
ncbi:hypothetical protein ABW19_dt0205629 [Dactylella cylindrospora]|nr:hypothetical protein ABW19_dt0205629 [Dactylella cylindrospora]